MVLRVENNKIGKIYSRQLKHPSNDCQDLSSYHFQYLRSYALQSQELEDALLTIWLHFNCSLPIYTYRLAPHQAANKIVNLIYPMWGRLPLLRTSVTYIDNEHINYSGVIFYKYADETVFSSS